MNKNLEYAVMNKLAACRCNKKSACSKRAQQIKPIQLGYNKRASLSGAQAMMLRMAYSGQIKRAADDSAKANDKEDKGPKTSLVAKGKAKVMSSDTIRKVLEWASNHPEIVGAGAGGLLGGGLGGIIGGGKGMLLGGGIGAGVGAGGGLAYRLTAKDKVNEKLNGWADLQTAMDENAKYHNENNPGDNWTREDALRDKYTADAEIKRMKKEYQKMLEQAKDPNNTQQFEL